MYCSTCGEAVADRLSYCTRDQGSLKEQTTNELKAAPARVLSEPVPSVTEHTTRAFEPIYMLKKTE